MTTESSRERGRRQEPGGEVPREGFESSSAAEAASREHDALIAEVGEAERQTDDVMAAAMEGLEEMPFELRQLKRDSEDFLKENGEVMRDIVEEAKREAAAVVEAEPGTPLSREYVAYLDAHFFPAAKASIDRLPAALKNDPDAVIPVINDMFEAAARKNPAAWDELNDGMEYDDLYATATPLGERYAEIFKNVGEAPFMKFAESYLGKRRTALERSRMSPEERRTALGGSKQNVQMMLETVRRLPLNADKKEQIVLRAAALNGPSVARNFPDLVEGVDSERLEDAFAEAVPHETVAALPEKTEARKVELLNLLAEMHPASAIEGLKSLPDMHEDVQVRVLVKALSANPSLAGNLDDLRLSSYEKIALGMRLARQTPEAFPDFMRAAAPALSSHERAALAQDLLAADVKLFRTAVQGLSLSHDETVDIIRHAPEAQRGDLLAAIGVPGRDAELMLDEARSHSIPTRLETKEDRETARLVEKVDRASVDLMLAMERSFIGAAEAERERIGEEQRLHGRIERIGAIGGGSANSPRYVMIEGRLLPAVYKSRLREREIRRGIPEGSMVGREVLASFIDRALRLGAVPATVLRNGPEGLAAVQDWKIGDIALTTDWRAPERREELKKIGFFDWLTQNSDRHPGNWLIGQDGRHVAIDNGAIFGDRVSEDDRLRSFPLTEVNGEPLPDDIRKNVAELVENREVMGILKEMFTTLLGDKDGKRAWKEFEGRLQSASDPDFRLPDSEWTVRHAALGQA